MDYRMFTDAELKDFRAWLGKCPFDRSAVQGAFDARPRRAKDQGEEPKGPSYLDAMIALKRKMSPEGFRALCEALLEETDESAEDDALPLHANEPETAQDTRLALDAYHRRFPNAPRGVRYEPELAKPVHMTAADARGYAARFPDSAKIGRA